jgi:hypothetical protein
MEAPRMFEYAVELEDAGGWKRVWTVLRPVFLLVWLVLLVRMWIGKIHNSQISTNLILPMILLLLALLFLLFLLEALEIAYTLLSDRHDDQFPGNAKTLIATMKANPHLVYEAREWLATLIVVAITLMTEYDDGTIPFLGSVGAHKLLWQPIPLLLTTLPVLWFAQGLGKTCARASPLKLLTWWPVRTFAWQFTIAMGWFITKTGLPGPGQLLWRLLKGMVIKGTQPLRPSDEGFFLSGLQRYGFAFHELAISITLKKDGTCAVEQKLVWYLLRFTGHKFSHKLYFDGPQKSAGQAEVRGFTCPSVGDEYAPVSKLLDRIWENPVPTGLAEILPKIFGVTSPYTVDRDKNRYESRLVVETYDRFPLDNAFVLTVTQKSNWEGSSFKRNIGDTDFYEMTFEYPCNRYKLDIVPEEGVNLYLAQVTASAAFRMNLHDDEKKRLEDARVETPTDGGLHSVFYYPLAGAKYRYNWVLYEKTQEQEQQELPNRKPTAPDI